VQHQQFPGRATRFESVSAKRRDDSLIDSFSVSWQAKLRIIWRQPITLGRHSLSRNNLLHKAGVPYANGLGVNFPLPPAERGRVAPTKKKGDSLPLKFSSLPRIFAAVLCAAVYSGAALIGWVLAMVVPGISACDVDNFYTPRTMADFR